MNAVETILEDGFSLRKALDYSGCSRKMYYPKAIPRTYLQDPFNLETMKRIALDRSENVWITMKRLLTCSGKILVVA